ncbi:MAG: thioredoxin family protein [Ignavibacteriales bacterium]|nr:thioredoxin family protein [Ignavibacteriales bacterium]
MPTLNKMNINNFLTYKRFVEEFNKQVNETDIESLNEYDKKYFDYRKLNFQRSSRLGKTFEPTTETKNAFTQISNKQTWFVITESWCGDSAQNLPVIAKLAELNNLIDLKIVLRDSNLEFMDLYLTNGGRSIPKLIAFDKDDNELFQWGPRPAEVQKLFSKLKADGIVVSEIHKELHLWYGRNRGKEIEKEIAELAK